MARQNVYCQFAGEKSFQKFEKDYENFGGGEIILKWPLQILLAISIPVAQAEPWFIVYTTW